MTAVPPDQPAEAASDVIERRPDLATAVLWYPLAVPMLGSLLLLFRLVTLRLAPRRHPAQARPGTAMR